MRMSLYKSMVLCIFEVQPHSDRKRSRLANMRIGASETSSENGWKPSFRGAK